MTNAKKAIITDEEAAKNSIEELEKTESETIEDEIEKPLALNRCKLMKFQKEIQVWK